MNKNPDTGLTEQEEAARLDQLTALANAMFVFTMPAHAAHLGAETPEERVSLLVESLNHSIAMARKGVATVQHNALAKQTVPLANNPATESVAVAAALLAHAKILLRNAATIKDAGLIDDAMMDLLGQMMNTREAAGNNAPFTPIYKIDLGPEGSIAVGAVAIEQDEMDDISKKVKDKYNIDKDLDGKKSED